MELRPVLICLVLALAPAGVCLTRLFAPPPPAAPGAGAPMEQRVSAQVPPAVWSRAVSR